MEYTMAKGVFDILPSETKEEDKWRESHRWQYVENVLRQTAHDYGFKELRTPIFERTQLFVRGVGEGTDIVSKEMYTFLDKGERSLTLRPEGTAPAMRAFVEHKLYAEGGLHKYYYLGPMFRYERPQAGRYRQHHQFGAEALGSKAPEQDVEVVDFLCEIYRRLGLKNLGVCINSVGDAASRSAYRQALSDYLTPFLSELSSDSQERFHKNILRILDSKDPKDRKILTDAPIILDYLQPECKEHFEKILELLDALNISYKVEPNLVRGLDYYDKTVFEVTAGELGAQNSIGGGGRYDGLTAALGGPHLPAVGFATGLERLLQTMLKQQCGFPKPSHPFIFLIPLGEKALQYCFLLLCRLRHEKIPAEIALSAKKVQQGLSLANAGEAEYALVIGEEELSSQRAALKNLATRETQEVALDSLVGHIRDVL
ncbi:MAG TPA: histidine--tRNA ligase [Rhabdochlamydiaceae bacterium]|jgi:histidyl-tRNA synthetase